MAIMAARPLSSSLYSVKPWGILVFFFSSSTTIFVVIRERRTGTRDAERVAPPENDEMALDDENAAWRGMIAAPDTKAVWEVMFLESDEEKL